MALEGQAQPNDGLLDARGVAQTLHALGSGFRAVEFADYCSIAEEIVLRERIILCGKIQQFPRHLQSVLGPIIEDGIFVPLRVSYPMPDLPTDMPRVRASRVIIEDGLTAATLDDAWHEVSRVLGAEAVTGAASTPLLRSLQHYGVVRRPRIENAIWDLAAQYRKVADLVEAARYRQQAMAGLPAISFPPIALFAMSRAKDFSGLYAEILQLRHDFRHLRQAVSELEDSLRSKHLSLGEAIELESCWRQRWQALVDAAMAGRPAGRLSVARTSFPLLRGGGKIVAAAAIEEPGLALDGLLDVLGTAANALGYMQLRPVHRSVSNYMRMSDYEVRRAVANLFRYDFARLEADMWSLARVSNSPWRAGTIGARGGGSATRATGSQRQGPSYTL